ncbi:hypothetical protein DPMN_071789 [Dreissena polymorpha]|uniref:Uncharacterized protein n=1 Tax=Dreissena polymorpha TaxID=45954 RepID=A0A9D3Z3B9_DREPO|nr:hypothetical protein DPMN_071789 [Dreissena polymorpha]
MTGNSSVIEAHAQAGHQSASNVDTQLEKPRVHTEHNDDRAAHVACSKNNFDSLLMTTA